MKNTQIASAMFWGSGMRKIVTIMFVVIMILVFVPLPMRCEMESIPAAPWNPGIFPEGITPPPPPPQPQRSVDYCYSFLNPVFWSEEGEVRFYWMRSFDEQEKSIDGVWVRQIYFSYPADYSNDELLLGASHNVFIGKVLTQTGTIELAGNPTTQYHVEVINNIKGDAAKVITLNQEGGYKDGVQYIIKDGAPPLQLGSTYVLATRYRSADNSYTLNAHANASKLLTTDSRLSDAQLRVFADKDSKVNTFISAYVNEVLLQADIVNANTLNSFNSLPPNAKAAAQARAEEARGMLEKLQ